MFIRLQKLCAIAVTVTAVAVAFTMAFAIWSASASMSSVGLIIGGNNPVLEIRGWHVVYVGIGAMALCVLALFWCSRLDNTQNA